MTTLNHSLGLPIELLVQEIPWSGHPVVWSGHGFSVFRQSAESIYIDSQKLLRLFKQIEADTEVAFRKVSEHSDNAAILNQRLALLDSLLLNLSTRYQAAVSSIESTKKQAADAESLLPRLKTVISELNLAELQYTEVGHDHELASASIRSRLVFCEDQIQTLWQLTKSSNRRDVLNQQSLIELAAQLKTLGLKVENLTKGFESRILPMYRDLQDNLAKSRNYDAFLFSPVKKLLARAADLSQRIESLADLSEQASLDTEKVRSHTLKIERLLTVLGDRVFTLECTSKQMKDSFSQIDKVVKELSERVEPQRQRIDTGSFVGGGKNIELQRIDGKVVVNAVVPPLPDCPVIIPPPPPPVIQILQSGSDGKNCFDPSKVPSPTPAPTPSPTPSPPTPTPDPSPPDPTPTPSPPVEYPVKPCGSGGFAYANIPEDVRTRLSGYLSEVAADRKANGPGGCFIIGSKYPATGAGDHRYFNGFCYGRNTKEKMKQYLREVYPYIKDYVATNRNSEYKVWRADDPNQCDAFGDYTEGTAYDGSRIKWFDRSKAVKSFPGFGSLVEDPSVGWS